MATGAVRKLFERDSFFLVLCSSFIWLVVMAPVAGIFDITVWVAGIAGNFTLFAVIQGKAVLYQQGRCPGLGAVAILAFQPKEPGMDVWLGVTLCTSGRRAGEDLISMTFLAGDLGVASVQREDGLVVEIGHSIHAVMAGDTVATILCLVLDHESSPFIPLRMAGYTAFLFKALGISCVATKAGEWIALIIHTV